MASTSSNISFVYDLYGRLLAVLDVEEPNRYQSDTDNTRELRFTIRKAVYNLIKLVESESRDKDTYKEGMLAAVGKVRVGSAENIAYGTALVLHGVLDDAEWGFREGKAEQDQPINVTLREILQGLKATINTLSAMLREDGTEDVEYSDDEGEPAKQKTLRKPKSKAVSDPTESSVRGRGNFTNVRGVLWADRESLELLYVERDHPRLTNARRTDEFNRRMAAVGAGSASSGEHERTPNAYRLQLRKLKDAQVTIASLESGLAIGEEGEEKEGDQEAGDGALAD